jgi:hypothetical protein
LLFAFHLNPARTDIVLAHPGLQDRVDDRVPFNLNPVNTEAAETLFGTGFGAPFAGTIAIERSPDGFLYVLTATGRIYVITLRCWADIVSIGGLPPPDGLLTADDFIAFFGAYFGGEELADIASIGMTAPPDGLLTSDDFLAFLGWYFAGCS